MIDPRPLEDRLKPRFWYGWIVLAIVFGVMATLIGVRNSLGFFFKDMAGEFGWSRAQIAAAYSVGMIAQGAASPLAGWLSDRWGPRRTISAGVLIGGSALLLASSVQRLWQLYLMYALLSVGFAAATFVPQVHILSNWFAKKRGLAMGISTSSQGFATFLNLATPALIGLLGWRGSYTVLAGFALLITFPISAAFLRNDPSEKFTVPDAPFLGIEERMTLSARRTIPLLMEAPAPPGVWSRIYSLRFFLLAGLYAVNAFVFTGTVVHLVPHATDQGFTLAGGSVIFIVWGGFIMAGNIASGMSDRIGRAPTYLAGALFGAVSAVLLGLIEPGAHPARFYAGAAMSGFSLGLLRPTVSSLTADLFEGPGFGKINGAIMMVFGIFGALGAYVPGALFDGSRSYRSAFLLMAATLALGGVIATALSNTQANAQE